MTTEMPSPNSCVRCGKMTTLHVGNLGKGHQYLCDHCVEDWLKFLKKHPFPRGVNERVAEGWRKIWPKKFKKFLREK